MSCSLVQKIYLFGFVVLCFVRQVIIAKVKYSHFFIYRRETFILLIME